MASTPKRIRDFVAPFFVELPTASAVTANYIKEFAQMTPLNSGVTICTSLLLATALWPTAPRIWLISWLVILCSMSALIFLRWWNRRNKPVPAHVSDRGLRKAKLWGLLSGTSWGVTVAFMPLVSQTQQLAIVIVCCAMAAGGTATLAAVPQAAALFIFSAIGPFAVYFAVQGDPMSFTLSALALLMIVGMLGLARTLYGSFMEQAKVKKENLDLLKKIQVERQEWLDFSEGSEAFVLYDEQGFLLLWNETFERLFSIPKEALYRGMRREDVLRIATKPVTMEELGLGLDDWIDRRLESTNMSSTTSIHKLEDGRWVQSVSRKTRNGHMAVINVDITALKQTETAMRDAEDRFHTLVESAPESVVLVDPETDRIVLTNSKAENFFGYDRATLAELDPRDLVVSTHHDDQDVTALVSGYVQQAVDGETPVFELTLRNHQNSPVPCEVRLVRLFLHGRPMIRASITNISERKAAEQAMRSSEANLQAAQKMARIGNWDWDPETGLYVCSEQLLDLFGFDQAVLAISPDQFVNAIHLEDRPGAASAIEEMKKRKLPGRDLRFRIKQSDGRIIHALASGRANLDDAGNFIGSSGTLQDITEFVEAQEALIERETRLQGVMDGVPDGIIAIDEESLIESFNPAAEKMFGYSAHEMIGKTVTTLMSATDAAYHNDHIDRHRRTGEGRILGRGAREVNGIRKDGSFVPIELSVSEINLAGSKLFIGVVRDISERKETEERLLQAQKMEAVGQLTGGVAHDFNNMLAVVTGNLELLGEYDEVAGDEELADLLGSAVDAAKRGAELTRRLLAFSRRQPLKSRPTEVNSLIDGMLGLTRRTLGENIEILFEPSKESMLAEIDPAQLESAFLNLAINSRDAMLMGGTVSITTQAVKIDKPSSRRKTPPEIAPGDYVLLKVTDTGGGMSREVLDKVFEPFFTTKPIGEGTGLGLSMVYGFIKQSGGHVSIESKVGKGTSVSLYLPWSDEPIADIQGHGDVDLAGRGKGQTILIVEDDASVRKLVVSLIKSLGYKVIERTDAKSALEALDATPEIDLMFTDIILGKGMNGVDLGREALKRRQHLKVLYTSGYAESAIFDDRWRREGIELINKPYRKAELARKLSETLSEAVE